MVRSDDHKLAVPWCFWHLKHCAAENWEQNMKIIAEVDTVEKFWDVLDSLPTPSSLSNTDRLALFKKGIPPMWEHERNARGGSTHMIVREPENKGKSGRGSFDEVWYELLMLLVGEQLSVETAREVNGIVCGRTLKLAGTIKVDYWLRSEPFKYVAELAEATGGVIEHLSRPMDMFVKNTSCWKALQGLMTTLDKQ